MNYEQLKNSILGEAICGRLVPQNPDDEPASLLLDKIEGEKAALVKAKRIKPDKNASRIYRTADGHWMERFADKHRPEVCIDEEIPFDIPETWEWARVRNIFETTSGSTPLSRNKDYYENGTINWVRTTDLNNGVLSKAEIKITQKAFDDCHLQILPKNSVCIAMYGGAGTIGKNSILDFETTINQSVCAIIPNGQINMKFVYYFIQYQRPYWMKFAAGSRKDPNINQIIIKHCIIPIPPINEQHRIVAKLEEILPKVEEYGKAQDRLDALNSALPEKLRASILQEAIEGRLVPQPPEDEPASLLLDKIEGEKVALVKAKKIKPDKNASRIYRTSDGHWMERFYDKHRPEACIDDEIPFDIPETWELVRLGNIAQLNMGKTPERDNAVFWNAKDFSWVSIADMIPSGITRETKEYISKEAAEKCFKGDISKKGSLLMSFKLTIGRTTILDMDAYHNEAIITIIPHYDSDYCLRDYLFTFLPMLANQGDSKEAIKGKTLNSKSLYNILIPLPPLSEQRRIVEKLEEILPKVEALE